MLPGALRAAGSSIVCAPFDPNCFLFQPIRCLPKSGHFGAILRARNLFVFNILSGAFAVFQSRGQPRTFPPSSPITRSKSCAKSTSEYAYSLRIPGLTHIGEFPLEEAAPPPLLETMSQPLKLPSPPT